MSKVLIGKDVVAYVVTGGGIDTTTNTFSPSANYTMLGRWESIEIETSADWFVTTSSDAQIKERRQGPVDWKASLKGLIRDGGSAFLLLAEYNSYVQFTFTESSGGRTITGVAGIDRAGAQYSQEAWKDSLELINVGYGLSYT